MNIIFIGNWSINEGLTDATFIPHLKILSGMPIVKEVIFCTIERGNDYIIESKLRIPKITHVPINSKSHFNSMVGSALDFLSYRNQILDIAINHQSELIICRGSPAGSIGYYIHKKSGIPFFVESFEPHADYMLESGVWRKYNLKYIMEKYWEEKQKKYAKGLMPVANNYRQKLVMEGVDASKLYVIPCSVELEEFKYMEEQRLAIRRKLNIEDEITGIYVGKFGGIYYSDEAYKIFYTAFEYFKNNFKLIILTPDNRFQIRNKLIEIGVNKEIFFVGSVSHSEVPSYLSAADFAFSLYRPSRSKKFLSPIKNGEYWANGLPIIMTKGIGDDSKIIDSEGGGETFDFEGNDLIKALQKIQVIIQSGSREETFKEIRGIASRYRNFNIAQKVYKKVYSAYQS